MSKNSLKKNGNNKSIRKSPNPYSKLFKHSPRISSIGKTHIFDYDNNPYTSHKSSHKSSKKDLIELIKKLDTSNISLHKKLNTESTILSDLRKKLFITNLLDNIHKNNKINVTKYDDTIPKLLNHLLHKKLNSTKEEEDTLANLIDYLTHKKSNETKKEDTLSKLLNLHKKLNVKKDKTTNLLNLHEKVNSDINTLLATGYPSYLEYDPEYPTYDPLYQHPASSHFGRPEYDLYYNPEYPEY